MDTLDEVSEEQTAQGIRVLILHGVAILAMVAVQGGPFLPAFLLELGGSNSQIGLLTTIALLSQGMQLPGLVLLQRYPRRKAILVASALAYRLSWIMLALVPVCFHTGRVPAVLAMLLFAEMTGALCGPAWNSLLREVLPREIRGHVMARRLALGTLASIVLTLLGGWFLSAWSTAHPGQEPLGYSMIFLLGVALGFLGLYFLVQLPERTMVTDPAAPLLELLKKPFDDGNFGNLLAFAATWNLAVNVASPFFIVYLMRRLGLGLGMVTALTVTSQIANVLFLNLWGRLADRSSNKSVLALACPLFLVAVLAWLFTTLPGPHCLTVPLLFGIYLLSGMSMAGVSVASTNIALELSPPGDAASYLTLHGLVSALSGALGPLVGGVLADQLARRGVSLVLFWKQGRLAGAIPALELWALDFVFLTSFLLGLYSLHRLRLVEEEGEVTESELRSQFLTELGSIVRGFSPLPGIRILVTTPIALLHRLKSAGGIHTRDRSR